jgi:putative SOS response-associated peptidase YedK
MSLMSLAYNLPMCGALAYYTANDDSLEFLSSISVVWNKDIADFSSYNIRPTQSLLAVSNTENPEVKSYRFGFTPVFNDKALWFNTRSNKFLSGKGYWNRFRNKRCLILANGFYEWAGEKAPKQPHYIQLKDVETFAFAGLWNSFEKDGVVHRHASIITTEPNHFMKPIHNRMPVILSEENYADWLSPEPMELVEIGDYLQRAKSAKLRAHKVGKEVGKNSNNYAELIEPLT